MRWIGLALSVCGAALFLGALMQLRALENTKVLVTTGLFSRIRHPVYLGFILWYVGWPLYHGAVLSLGLGWLGIISTLWWRTVEEKHLVVQFGDAYRQYTQRTWF